MRLHAGKDGAVAGLALVAGRHRKTCRLADDAEPRFQCDIVQHGDKIAHAQTPDLLVVGKGKVQRLLQLFLRRLQRCGDGAGDETLHVGRAAAVEAAVRLAHLKRRYGPVLAVRRHHVGVAGEDDAIIGFRADRGEQVCLLSGGIGDDLAGDPEIVQQAGDMIDQRPVGIAAHRRKCDEVGKDVD